MGRSTMLGAAYRIVGAALLFCFADAVAAAASGRAGVPVFTHGEKGYPCIRIPSIIKTNASLLAFAGTRCGKGDGCFPHHSTTTDHMDLVMKRSTDNGATWSDMKVLYRDSCDERDHGTPVYDEVRGRVVLVTRGTGDRTFTLHSDDDGATWSTPVPVPLGRHNTSRPSPGRGLQLRTTNKHAPGRLLFVAQLGSGGKWARGNVVYFSDDGGESWDFSRTVVPNGQEAQIVELSNGTLLLNARRGLESGHIYNRLFATSDDGGRTWTNGTIRNDLDAASCMGSFLSHDSTEDPTRRTDPQQLLLYSHPASFQDRTNGTVWTSTDNAASFSPFFQVSPSDHSVPFAYSCLTNTHKADTVGLLYETAADGCRGQSCGIRFTSFAVGAAANYA